MAPPMHRIIYRSRTTRLEDWRSADRQPGTPPQPSCSASTASRSPPGISSPPEPRRLSSPMATTHTIQPTYIEALRRRNWLSDSAPICIESRRDVDGCHLLTATSVTQKNPHFSQKVTFCLCMSAGLIEKFTKLRMKTMGTARNTKQIIRLRCKWSSGQIIGLVTFRLRVRILLQAICKQP